MKFALELKASLDNVESLATVEDMQWFMKVKCSNCGEEHANVVYVTAGESTSTGRGEANLVIKCKMCRRENSVDILTPSIQKYTISDQWQKVVTFDCRGIEPTAYLARDGFVAVATSGTKFDEVDFTDDDFADYDEKSGEAVSVMDIKGRFVTVK
eukprot:TRINITY_DN974_c0_g1_i1.p1 TRINITY_DN974_c0_g1~~TRINITY_DN974_c0_g1_i1.p1  ORF type:complete len:155 (-),score=39.57 TRINITY_DN974_c0_g1_i1:162-626(-)